MSPPPPNSRMLDQLHCQALRASIAAADPIIRQQYADLARSYATAAAELREHGAAILPPPDPALVPWRSVQLRVTNDQ